MKTIKLWRLLLVVILPFSSCSNYLTIDPDNRTVAEGYYDSDQRVEQAVIGIYVDLRRALLANHAWLMYGEVRAGDLVVAAPHFVPVAGQDLTADNFTLKEISDWRYFYDVIKSADEVVDIVGNSEPELLTAYQHDLFKGEAMALKSMAYFYLARVWGEVPSAEPHNFGQRLTGQAALEIAADYAREAVELLPWLLLNDDGIESGALSGIRFNKTTATLLLAQEELWRGRAPEAYSALALLFSDNADGRLSSFGLSMGQDRRTIISTTPLSASLVSMPLATLNTIYPDADQRRSRLFTISQDRATLIVRDQTVLPLLKTEEIDLLMAEAAWRSGRLEEGREMLTRASEGAVEDYSEITDSEFEEALLLERQRLLIGTGQRFFDLIRFGQVSRYVPALSESDVSNGAAYWPVSPRSLAGSSWNQQSFWIR